MSGRVEGGRIYCHGCFRESEQSHGSIECPQCHSDFTEIVEPGNNEDLDSFRNRPPSPPPHLPQPEQRLPPHPFASLLNHNPWDDANANDPGNFTTFEFNGNGIGGHISFTTRTTRGFGTGRLDRANGMAPPFAAMPFPFGGGFPRDPRAGVQPGNMQDLFSLLLQSMQPPNQILQNQRGDHRDQDMPPNPFEFLGQLLNPANARHGDTVYSDEALDRIVSQLMQQNGAGSNAPPPADPDAISALPTKKIDAEMLGTDGKAECSICMDSVELGAEVTALPCQHWFHGDCVKSWLREHDTCPHCRKPISEPSSQRPEASRRRSSRPHRRPSSVSSPRAPPPGTPRSNTIPVPESPSSLRETRQNYYGRRRDSDGDHPGYTRHSSSRSDRNTRRSGMRGGTGGSEDERDAPGGITGWIRDHLPFSGS